jgi:aryl-alcohol dehydrogenase-like predicted oxidoreductase
MLRQSAGDLLERFGVSTKVGCFPGRDGGRPTHDLDVGRLRNAVEQAADDLGQRPAVVLLHNPEASLPNLPPAQAAEILLAACRALYEAVRAGLADAWGLSTWHPGAVTAALAAVAADERPRPAVLMVRTGLLVSSAGLLAAEELSVLLRPGQLWGMSPFGGNTSDPVWTSFDSRMFMEPDQPCTRLQAAFRVAAELPSVDHLVVGTDRPDHLRELDEATRLRPKADTIAAYRELLRIRSGRSEPSAC